jgi:hypothetical protein
MTVKFAVYKCNQKSRRMMSLAIELLGTAKQPELKPRLEHSVQLAPFVAFAS